MKQNFKRIAAAVLALCITAGAMPVLKISSPVTTAYAAEEEGTLVEKNGMVYTEFADHISLIYCEPDGDTLYIPDMIDSKPVTEIGDDAFSEDIQYHYGVDYELPDSVKKVIIPEGVEVICEYAFASEGSENLREVHFPSTLKKVGFDAFSNNYRLNVYDLPETAELESCSFANTFFAPESRINFIIKDEMSYIDYPDHVAMVYCEPDGDTVYFPDTVDGKPVTEIATRYEFYDISKASRYLEIPYFNDDIRKVYIPEGVEIVSTVLARSSLFSDECEGIYEVYLPSTLKKVKSYAFAGNKHLNVYGLPETAEIGRFAFEETCYDVESRANLVIKNGMIYADYSDHIDMIYCEPEGDTLYIPDMIDGKPVTEIHGNQAALLHKIDVEVEIPSLPDTVKKVYIPEGVEVIGSDVFECDSDKEGLYEVYLPSTLKIVGEYAFSHNKHLNVYGLPETAEIEELAFNETHYSTYRSANVIVKDGMIYGEYSDHVEILYCEPEGDTLYIPDMINGKPVTEICGDDEGYFDYWGIEIPILPDSVKEVIIPEGVTVRDSAFAGTKFEGQFTTTPVSEVMYGDANLDGKITLADSLAILQFIANEDKYPLSAQAQKNADCFNPGDGITGNDAVAVMRYDTKTVSKLPIIEK